MRTLERDLREIGTSTARMLAMVREGVAFSRRALLEADVDAAERSIAGDAAVDALQHDLEQRILTTIARRQPAAKDLRFLGAMVQALADIERAGDYAAHVARAGAELAAAPPHDTHHDLERILVVLDGMLGATIRALEEGDAAAAHSALRMDDEIDTLYERMQRELLTAMVDDTATISTAIKLLAVARYLERCGDHVENVNEHVIFWLTGRRL
jgi:phosphate transport system protein